MNTEKAREPDPQPQKEPEQEPENFLGKTEPVLEQQQEEKPKGKMTHREILKSEDVPIRAFREKLNELESLRERIEKGLGVKGGNDSTFEMMDKWTSRNLDIKIEKLQNKIWAMEDAAKAEAKGAPIEIIEEVEKVQEDTKKPKKKK